jgi:ubiquitin C-terminal hydrolase
VNNFAIPFTAFIDIHRLYSLPVYFTTSLGIASATPVDDALYIKEMRENVSVSGMMTHVLKKYGGYEYDFEQTYNSSCSASFRLWILQAKEEQQRNNFPEYSKRTVFDGSRYEWILVTEKESDYQKDCQGFLWNLFPSSSSFSSSSKKPASAYSLENNRKLCFGLMIENITSDGHWPVDNLIGAEFWRNITVLSSLEESSTAVVGAVATGNSKSNTPRNSAGTPSNKNNNKKGGNSSPTPATGSSSSHVLRIGLQVDLLTDSRVWTVGEIVKIAKIDEMNELSSLKRNILLTISVVGGTTTDKRTMIDLPLESQRILVKGTLTDILSIRSLPPLECYQSLTEETIKRIHFLAEKMTSTTTVPLLLPSTAPSIVFREMILSFCQQRKEANNNIPASQEKDRHPAEGEVATTIGAITSIHSSLGNNINNNNNSIPVTPTPTAASSSNKVFKSSVVPINVVFSPDPPNNNSNSNRSDQFATPKKGGSGSIHSNINDNNKNNTVVPVITREELEMIDPAFLLSLSEEAEEEENNQSKNNKNNGNLATTVALRLLSVLRLSQDYFDQEIHTTSQLPVSFPLRRRRTSTDKLDWKRNSSYYNDRRRSGRGGGGTMVRKNEETTTAITGTNNNANSGMFSPGKQLLSQWEKFFPGGGSGGGGNNNLNNPGDNSNNNNNESNNNIINNTASQETLPPFTSTSGGGGGADGEKSTSSSNILSKTLPPKSMSTNNSSQSNLSLQNPSQMSNNNNNSSNNMIPNPNPNPTNPVVPNPKPQQQQHTETTAQPLPTATTTTTATAVSSSNQQQQQLVTRIGIIGLNNLGNTCFLSSALQCLLRSPVFIAYFLSFQYKFDINDRSRFGTKGKLTEEFAEFVRTVYHPNPHSLTTTAKEQQGKGSGGATNSNQKLSSSSSLFANNNNTANNPRKASHPAITAFNAAFTAISNNNPNPANNNNNNNSNNNNKMKSALHPHNSARIALSPVSFYKLFQSHKSQFTGADQQDAQEFLAELLDTFHEDLKNNLSDPLPAPASNNNNNNNPSGAPQSSSQLEKNQIYNNNRDRSSILRLSIDHPISTPSMRDIGNNHHNDKNNEKNSENPKNDLAATGKKNWEDYIRCNDSVVSNVFQGQLCTHVTCQTCHHSSSRFEPFSTLSLPLPRSIVPMTGAGAGPLSTSSSLVNRGGDNDLVTLVIKFARKLPRISIFWRLYSRLLSLQQTVSGVSREEWFQKIQGNRLLETIERRRETKRFVLKLPRNTSMDTIKKQTVDFLINHYYNNNNNDDKKEENNNNNNNPDPNNPDPSVSKNKSSSDLNVADQREKEIRLNDLTVIDISTDEKYRIRKIVENRETLSSLLEENYTNPSVISEMELLIQENNSDIGFISVLPGNKLTVSPEQFYRQNPPLSIQQLLSSPAYSAETLFSSNREEELNNLLYRLCSGYMEEEEYGEDRNLYHQWGLHLMSPVPVPVPGPGPVSSPMNNTMTKGTTGLSSSVCLPEKMVCDLDYRYIESQSKESSSQSSKQQQKEKERIRSSSVEGNSSKTTGATRSSFPKSLGDFQLYDRVDALDHKGQWYSGTVVEAVFFHPPPTTATATASNPPGSASSRKKPPVMNPSSSQKNLIVNNNNNNNSSEENKDKEKEKEYYVRVHFDNFSAYWDEWYDKSDFAKSCLLPIYTKSSRKLKIYDIQIIQRRMIYTTNTGTGVTGSEKSSEGTPRNPNNPNTNSATASTEQQQPLELVKMDMIESPFLVQIESYRSVGHLWTMIAEQIYRYLPTGKKERKRGRAVPLLVILLIVILTLFFPFSLSFRLYHDHSPQFS